MDELISRQDAIAATMETVFVEYEDGDTRKEESIILQTKAAIRDRIKALPSVQTDVPDMNDGDMISRQAAKNALTKATYPMPIQEDIWKILRELPPVQPTQPNCEYCHTDRDGYVFPLEKNSHAFIDRDKIVLKANGWRGEAKIKYCPICGRRLADG